MEFNNWLVYALAAIGLTLTPGPNGLLALTHGALYGARRTLATIFGGVIGFGLVVGLSLFGIGAILQASSGLLLFLKWVGGAYLIFLGIQVWRSPAIGVLHQDKKPSSPFSLFSSGFLSAVSNPKGILFFVAFLPQFVDPDRSLFIQFVVMAGTFMVLEFFYELTVASLSGKIQPWLKKIGKNFNRFFGLFFMAIGVLLPLRG